MLPLERRKLWEVFMSSKNALIWPVIAMIGFISVSVSHSTTVPIMDSMHAPGDFLGKATIGPWRVATVGSGTILKHIDSLILASAITLNQIVTFMYVNTVRASNYVLFNELVPRRS